MVMSSITAFCLIPYFDCFLLHQTAQRKIREIIQQVKQQEQKHQQGAPVPPHHAKWPVGAAHSRHQPMNVALPKWTETYPDEGQGDMQGRPAAPGTKPKNFIGGNVRGIVCTASPAGVGGERRGG